MSKLRRNQSKLIKYCIHTEVLKKKHTLLIALLARSQNPHTTKTALLSVSEQSR